MEEFERTWPASFHETRHKCVTTMAAIAQRQGKVNNMKILGTEMIYARAMALQCSQRYYDTRNLMAHELASRPASMFDDSGAMKVAKTKAVLKNTLKVEMERRHAEVDATFFEGCAVLWVVPWPTGGTVQDFLNNVRRHIQSHLDSSSCSTDTRKEKLQRSRSQSSVFSASNSQTSFSESCSYREQQQQADMSGSNQSTGS